jgi:signal transduction histidine kinase
MELPKLNQYPTWPIGMFRHNVLVFLVIALSILIGSIYIGSIADYYDLLRTKCVLEPCGIISPAPPATVAELSAYHLTPDSYAMLFVVIDCTFTFLFYLAAILILWKGYREPMGLLAAVFMVAFGTTFPGLTFAATADDPFLAKCIDAIAMIGWVSLFLFFILFPNGRFVPRWTLIVFILFAAVNVSSFLFEGTPFDLREWPFVMKGSWYLVSVSILIYSQVYRFRHVSQPEQRQQTKWVVYGVPVALSGFIGISLLFDPSYQFGAIAYVYLNAILHLFLLLIPVTLTLAILRHRLWDIDPLVNRTLVYGALSICVIVVYTLSVLYLGRLFRTEDNFFVSLIATSFVAVLFAPLKERLQRLVNRFMKGRHDDPYAVLVELGNHLIKPLAPEAMLDAVAHSIKDALRLPYVGISIVTNGQDTLAAAAGDPKEDLLAYPIIHRGEEQGTLFIAHRSPGEAFTSQDDQLLDVLLRQAGPVVQNVNMTLGMKLLAADLQESREKLVLAREEERRQIRRNLHDDLAPRLAALALNAATAEKYVKKDPDASIELLADLRKVIRTTVDEIRTLVHDLRPPTLDELGLLGAIQERVTELAKTTQHLADDQEVCPLQIQLLSPPTLPALPATVEVAAYRIITESLVNVVRHAKATACTVSLDISQASNLIISVTDNGMGLPHTIKPSGKGGIGLVSIRERATELGGHCAFERLEGGGTRVIASLPF